MTNGQFGLIFLALALAAAAFLVWKLVIQRNQETAKEAKLYDGTPTPTLNFADVTAWFVGPHPQGEPSRSIGLPLHPEPIADGLWRVCLPRATWPNPQFQLHGISINAGSLAGKSDLYAKVRVTLPDGGVLRAVNVDDDPPPVTAPGYPALMVLGAQRTGDPWTDDEKTEFDRFYATFAGWMGVASGIHEFAVPLDARALAIPPGAGWTDAQRHSQQDSPAEFEATKAQCEDVFIGCGGGSGWEHGFWLDAPEGSGDAFIDLLEFRIS